MPFEKCAIFQVCLHRPQTKRHSQSHPFSLSLSERLHRHRIPWLEHIIFSSFTDYDRIAFLFSPMRFSLLIFFPIESLVHLFAFHVCCCFSGFDVLLAEYKNELLDKNDQNAAHTNRYNLEMLSIFCLPEDLHNTKSYVSCAIVKPFFSFSLPNYDDEPRIFAIFLSSNEMIYLLAHRDITHMRIAHKPIHSHLIANIAFVCALWSD